MEQIPHYKPVSVEGMGGPEGEWVFFYGGIFSNFTLSPFNIAHAQPWITTFPHPRRYETVEHFFQASKAVIEYDHEKIRLATSPGMAKLLGNQEQSFVEGSGQPLLRQDWEAVKYDVMVAGCRVKFQGHPVFEKALLETGDAQIAEDSPSDFVWGIRDGNGGFTGHNLLGKALMQVREELRAG